MYNSRTVFVVGAGASYEIGLPTGEGLKEVIRELLDIRYEFGTNPISGSYRIAHAIRGYCNGETGDLYNEYLHAGWHIRDAINLAISIDNFVDNQDDEIIASVAKLAIAESILIAENGCKLFPVEQDRGSPQIDLRSLEDTWLLSLFKTLTEGRKASDLVSLFDNVSFIVFNYDRAIEFYLVRAIEVYFSVSQSVAEEVVKRARFYHPYGTVGQLPWQDGDGPIADFGAEDGFDLFEISQSIITFTEQIEDKVSIENIRKEIDQADQLLFLGFAYHDANMELLQPTRKTGATRMIGTAYNISDNDCDVIRNRLLELCVGEGEGTLTKRNFRDKFIIDSKTTCVEFMNKYQRSIRS